MNSARKFLFYAEKFERQEQEWNAKKGFTADSVFIYYRGAIRSYKKVLNMPPVQLNLNVVQKNWMKN